MTPNYRIQLLESWTEVPSEAWDELVLRTPDHNPLQRHAALLALESTGSACSQTGWQNLIFLVWRGQDLLAGAHTYLKNHSWGEYVFDWAWADAYRRHGLNYYPKLLGALPFSPLPGPRLLGTDPEARWALSRALVQTCQDFDLSSAHLLFCSEEEGRFLKGQGWLLRQNVQFHWQKDRVRPETSLDDMVSRMQRHKRKNIAQERSKVRAAGVSFRILEGTDIGATDWDHVYRCYERTYELHGGQPYLTRSFFHLMESELPNHWVMFVAEHEGEPVASSLVLIDRPTRRAWGRYWGTLKQLPCLHFEACYYQPLDWCIRQGFDRFEGGAQGEHKMARGLMPVTTWSAHYLRDERFASAVADFLDRERDGIESYQAALEAHSPFRPPREIA